MVGEKISQRQAKEVRNKKRRRMVEHTMGSCDPVNSIDFSAPVQRLFALNSVGPTRFYQTYLSTQVMLDLEL
jgi:hypothetical protein